MTYAAGNLQLIHSLNFQGKTNIMADWLSRSKQEHLEWKLHALMFHLLIQEFGLPAMDLLSFHNFDGFMDLLGWRRLSAALQPSDTSVFLG